MMNKQIVLATHNAGKIKELKRLLTPLGYNVIPVHELLPDIVEPEETGHTFEENARLKALYYMHSTGRPCLADDSGIVVDVLDGRPGIYSARYAGEQCDDEQNNAKLIRELSRFPEARRTAHYECVMVVAWPDGTILMSEGRCEGILRDFYAGIGGFGYDPLFYLPELGKTMAELSMEEKNKISHRGKALQKLVEQLS